MRLGHARVLLFGTAIFLVSLFFLGCGSSDVGSNNSSEGSSSGSVATDKTTTSNEKQADEPLEPIKMNVGYAATALMYAPQFAAAELEIYKKHGLDVELHFVSSTSQAVPAVRSGSVDIVATSGSAAIDAVAEGVTDLVILGDALLGTALEAWAQPEINSISDLIGKTISSTSPGSLGDRLTGVWLEKNGYKKSDVEIVYLGGLNNLVAGMRSKQTDATLLTPPLGNQLKSSGQKLLADLRDIPYSNHAFIAKKSYVEANPEAVERFMKASIEAIAVIKQEKERVLPVFPKYTGVEDPELNEYAYEFHVDMFEKVPLVDMEVLKITQDLSTNEKAHEVNLEDIVDNSFVEKIEAEGFIDSLY